MKYIYVCRAVPEAICNYRKSSVAGNKFSINMARSLNNACENGIEFISLAQVEQELIEKLDAHEIWPGKSYERIKCGRYFLISEFVQAFRLFCYLKNLIKKYKSNYTVVIENSPAGVAVCCTVLKILYKTPLYSITIDTPFTASLSRKRILGKLNCWKFRLGQKQLRHFNGIISFTKDVCKQLEVDVPCLEFAIGCEENKLPLDDLDFEVSEHEPRRVVYAGTLIYYNGIMEMLNAFADLGDLYQLHIYGYGPLEPSVIEMTKAYSNIVYHGRFNPDKTEEILGEADLLINPRIIDPYIENFTFPSKLIDYVISGRNVLSSKFKTLPKEYESFLYLMDSVSKESICNSVKFVFSESKEIRKDRVKKGISYIRNHQTYNKIAQKLLKFMEENTY